MAESEPPKVDEESSEPEPKKRVHEEVPDVVLPAPLQGGPPSAPGHKQIGASIGARPAGKLEVVGTHPCRRLRQVPTNLKSTSVAVTTLRR